MYLNRLNHDARLLKLVHNQRRTHTHHHIHTPKQQGSIKFIKPRYTYLKMQTQGPKRDGTTKC